MLGHPTGEAPTFVVRHTTEVHRHAQHLTAWSQEYEQTSGGWFEGRVREFRYAGLQAFEEEANRATAQYCRTWDDGVWFGMPTLAQADGLLYMGRPLREGQLMVAAGGVPFDLFVPAGVGLYGVVVRRADLERHLRQLDALPSGAALAALQADRPQWVQVAARQQHRLAALLREALQNLQAHPRILEHDASLDALREAVLTLLAQAWMPAERQTAPLRWRRRLDLVHRARERVLQQPHEHLTVQQLCEALYVTRRTLQNCFQDVLGMSPAAYLRTVRLNRVRQELLEGAPGQTVLDVAARWGFWHMGHFAHEYRMLFAETPSQTLRRRRAA